VIWPVHPEPKPKELPQFLRALPSRFSVTCGRLRGIGTGLERLSGQASGEHFIFDVCGDSMRGAGIFDGDKIVVDRSLEARHGAIIVAILNGEHTVKRLHISQDDGVELRPRIRAMRQFVSRKAKS
jgi:DNA polymerase V